MKIETEVPDKVVTSLLSCAFEGGSTDWIARITRPDSKPEHRSLYHSDIPMADGALIIVIQEAIKKDDDLVDYTLDRAACERGLKLMLEKHPEHFADAVKENEDATTGDVFLQCCLFGEIVFA